MPKPTAKRPMTMKTFLDRVKREEESTPRSSSPAGSSKGGKKGQSAKNGSKKPSEANSSSSTQYVLLNDRLASYKEIFCPLCDRKKKEKDKLNEIFHSRLAFQAHVRKCHADVDLVLTCGLCDKDFATGKQLAEHLQHHDNVGHSAEDGEINDQSDLDVSDADEHHNSSETPPYSATYQLSEKSENSWNSRNGIHELDDEIAVKVESRTPTPSEAEEDADLLSAETELRSKRKLTDTKGQSERRKYRVTSNSNRSDSANAATATLPSEDMDEICNSITVSCYICHDMVPSADIQTHYVQLHLSPKPNQTPTKRGSPMKDSANENFKLSVAKVLAATDTKKDDLSAREILHNANRLVKELIVVK